MCAKIQINTVYIKCQCLKSFTINQKPMILVIEIKTDLG